MRLNTLAKAANATSAKEPKRRLLLGANFCDWPARNGQKDNCTELRRCKVLLQKGGVNTSFLENVGRCGKTFAVKFDGKYAEIWIEVTKGSRPQA